MIELAPGIILLAFQNSTEAKSNLNEEILNESEILFKGDISLIMELASRYVLGVEEGKYKDYFYQSSGFSSPTMSLQTAIWATEKNAAQQTSLSYFIILKKIKTKAF